ncbi:MAG TPA: GntR family transcriptional regulator [Microlunatus sp.]
MTVGREVLAGVPQRLDANGTRVEQIFRHLQRLVSTLPTGAELPSERIVAEHFGVARMTAREAVDRLVEVGLAERIPRRGTFVGQPRFVHTRHLASYDDDIRARGMTPGGRKVSSRIRKASRAVAVALEIEPGDPYLDLVRLRTADGEPMAITHSQLSIRRFPGIESMEFPGGSLHGELARLWGVRAAQHSQRIRAVVVNAVDARLLEVPAGVAGFEMRGTSRDAEGVVIEFGQSVYRADRYEVVLHTDLPS